MDIDLLRKTINQYGKDRIAFIRMEATTNLIGGQPFSMGNLKEVSKIAKEFGIMSMIDCSLISENAYFIHNREPGFSDKSIKDIIQEMIDQVDLIYMSGRKSTKYFVNRLCEFGVPVVTPPGGLGCHVDAKKFLPHIPWNEYPAGALASAVYLVSGCRGMERGSLSMDRWMGK